ncbi:MAG: mannose-1-phosphate guanylyltransferase [Candidatus Berkelbacteria bacterium Licking1014_85]|uniref:Mannose-1-phosphate guanylyltransferase n=1 Tax=Candidatus Berkelbacteria bacterium Licking1014_85 TaxID=2017148 RepID=A0A554LKV7_9BACT|nr:MAG: mannose-1-phosphate guanylyltransferase [Candidatus Berkelbacteria bacterium Licking1014_85]
MQSHNYVLIIAGGSGTRFWPISTQENPKQFQKFIFSRSLIQNAYILANKIVNQKNIFIVATPKYFGQIKKHIPKIKNSNLVSENQILGTASAIALGIEKIYQLDNLAKVAVICADQNTSEINELTRVIKSGLGNCEKFDAVLVGVNPTYPSTEFGYIKIGKKIDNRLFNIESFKEKPDQILAEKFIKSRKYLWNSGMFVFSSKKYLELFTKLLPEYAKAIEQKNYHPLDVLPVDIGIIEKCRNLAVIKANIGLPDISTFKTIYAIAKKDPSGNAIVGKKVLFKDCQNCLIINYLNTVKLIGLNNLAIINTQNGLLVSDLNQVHKINELK